MPMYDYRCSQCGFEMIDVFSHSTQDKERPVCTNCSRDSGIKLMERVSVLTQSSTSSYQSAEDILDGRSPKSRAPAVIDDSIPGGILIKNGICNDDGTPKRYYSHTEIRQALEAKNRSGIHMVNKVEHIGERGSDKNKNTVRWV